MTRAGHWYDVACEVIAPVSLAHPDVSDRELLTLLRPLYPFGHRSQWPYKAWLRAVHDELHARRQRRFGMTPYERDEYAPVLGRDGKPRPLTTDEQIERGLTFGEHLDYLWLHLPPDRVQDYLDGVNAGQRAGAGRLL